MNGERVLRTRAIFGLFEDPDSRDPARSMRRRAHELLDLPDGSIALVNGPSGSGKSSLLRAIVDACAKRELRTERARPMRSARAPVELVGRDLHDALGTLAQSGLADARLIVRPARTLSDGESWRLGLARAMSRVVRSKHETVVIADEFCSLLDRVTAAGVCRSLRRWIDRVGRGRFVLATAHDDVRCWLSPDVLVELSLGEVLP